MDSKEEKRGLWGKLSIVGGLFSLSRVEVGFS
jgi:hypothetical protein